MSKPTCTIIAGPNGAGKTTFAMEFLPKTDCHVFLNADMIAAGLSPFRAEEKQLEAGKLFLREIKQAIQERENFAFETTLSGKSHLARVRRMLEDGWCVNLIYLWIPGVATSLSRVRQRVRQGGHNIPERDIRRRYHKSLKNLLEHYAPLCNEARCIDNSTRDRRLIFRQEGKNVTVVNIELFETLREAANMTGQTTVQEHHEVYDVAEINNEAPAKRRMEDVDTEFILDVLEYAVSKELERKRKLGYDAIIVENDTIMRLHPDGSMTEVGPVK